MGDRKSIKEMAEIYERVYGQQLTLENNGSIEDLNVLKDRVRAEHPDNAFKWMGM